GRQRRAWPLAAWGEERIREVLFSHPAKLRAPMPQLSERQGPGFKSVSSPGAARRSAASACLLLGAFVFGGCNALLGNSEPGQLGSSGGGGAVGSDGGASGGAPSSGGAPAASGGDGSGGQLGAECVPACPSDQGCLSGSCHPVLPECVGLSAGT